MGYIAAIPIGATQIEIAKRMINGYTFSAVMIVAGAVTSDFTYGILAMFGIAPFLQSAQVVACFSIANSIILIVLGILTLRQSKAKQSDKQETKDFLLKKRTSYVAGLMLAVANPLIIYWWLLGSRFLGGIYGIEQYNTSDIFLYLLSGTLGIASYPLSMLFGIHKTKKFFSQKTVMKTTFVFGIALFILAAYFLYEGLKYFAYH
jgi:threonine/homoserine/homoserine lactone efflux protein